MELVLTEAERKELAELVREAFRDLGPEIHHAEKQFRDPLRERRVLLEGLLHRLETGARAAA